MTDYVVPCETLARLSKLLDGVPDDIDPNFNTIRFDNGCVVVCDREFLACEHIGTIPGIMHIVPDKQFLAQCEVEAKFNGNATITVNEMLRYTVAKTSLGYVSGNIGYFPNGGNAFDRWREVVAETKTVSKNKGGMWWDAHKIAKLASVSPSGKIVFPEKIDPMINVLIRDTVDGFWIGVFSPKPKPGSDAITPAVLPNWMVC